MSSLSSPSKRLRVLHIARNLPPLLGGMERLNRQMAVELAKTYEVAVIGPQGCRSALPKSIEVSEISARPLPTFFFGALLQSVRMARRFQPDIVLGGSGLVAPFVWIAARLSGARSALYVHGLDLIVRHPVYRWVWRPFIRRADLCIANSRNTAELAVAIGVRESTITVVHPGVDFPAVKPHPVAFRSRFDLGERPVLLSVGRLIERKGLAEFVECALPRIAERIPDVCLVILGEESPDLLAGSSAGLAMRIRSRAAQLGLGGNVQFIGRQDDATLAAAYLESDIHVFPVRAVAGDIEGFGMVAVEAAAHGTPTVAFAVGGVADAIGDGVSGALIAPGDYAQMAEWVIDALQSRGDIQNRARTRDFARRFAWTEFGAKIRELLRALAASIQSR